MTSLSVGGTTVTDDTNKANALNNQFASVFTRENVSTIPVISGLSFPDMDNIQININGVAQLLSNLDPCTKGYRPRQNPNKVSKNVCNGNSSLSHIIVPGIVESGHGG